MTLVPTWIWFGFGSLIAAIGWNRRRKHFLLVLFGLWLLFLVLFAEEPRHFFPAHYRSSSRNDGQMLRVVSLNCAGESEAAFEVVAYHPDIVLLQESPGRSAVEKLARQLYGVEAGVLAGSDTAIVVHGAIMPQTVPAWWRCLRAHVRLTPGIDLEICNVRLSPDAIRLDLWDPECWKDHAQTRRLHDQQLSTILQTVLLPGKAPLILGGDFNALPRDPLFRLLRPRLHDTFSENGVGWGNTLMNDLALWRIDQVWVSEHFRTVTAKVHKTLHSDHRMVVCDLVVQNPGR